MPPVDGYGIVTFVLAVVATAGFVIGCAWPTKDGR